MRSWPRRSARSSSPVPGARAPGARTALARLAEELEVPVGVSPKGKGVFREDHPLYLGVFGFGGHESLIDYLKDGVDVLLACGAGLNDFSTNAWSPLLQASRAFVQVDIDPAQLGRNYPIDLGLVGPAEVVLQTMLGDREPRSGGAPRSRRLRTREPTHSAHGALSTIDVVQTLNSTCPDDAVFVSDLGEHLGIALHYFEVCGRRDFVTCLGFAAMGSGVCAAIGHQLGDPGRRVYAVVGDGCFLMHGAELVTAVHLGVPVTLVVINDSKLNMCDLGMRDLYGASTDMTTPVVDFAASARAAGAIGHLVRTKDELAAALEAEASGPVLIDVRVDPEVRLLGNQRNAALRQFQDA